MRDMLGEKRNDLRIDRSREGNGSSRAARGDSSLGELFGSLWSDTAHLIQMEVRLAKSEMHESVRRISSAGVKLGVAVTLALPGILAVTAAIVIGLGGLLHNYWLSALIVGVAILGVAGVLAKRAMAGLSEALSMQQTAHTLRESADWARDESRRVKARLTT